MDARSVIFYLIAGMILGTGFLSVTTRQIFRAAIYLLFSLIGIAGLYFWMDYQFIAAVQIIVYAGGIVVLIVFSIFLTQEAGVHLQPALRSRRLFGVLAGIAGILLTLHQYYLAGWQGNATTGKEISMVDIGTGMLSAGTGGYVLPFEVLSVLLLAAMVGCIVIALKPSSES